MNLENLELKKESLFKYMKSENYSISYIMAIQREIRWLLENSDSYKWSTYGKRQMLCVFLQRIPIGFLKI